MGVYELCVMRYNKNCDTKCDTLKGKNMKNSIKSISSQNVGTPSVLTILNKSSEKATFSFICNSFYQFNWSQHKKPLFPPTIELIITKVLDFIIFRIFGAF